MCRLTLAVGICSLLFLPICYGRAVVVHTNIPTKLEGGTDTDVGSQLGLTLGIHIIDGKNGGEIVLDKVPEPLITEQIYSDNVSEGILSSMKVADVQPQPSSRTSQQAKARSRAGSKTRQKHGPKSSKIGGPKTNMNTLASGSNGFIFNNHEPAQNPRFSQADDYKHISVGMYNAREELKKSRRRAKSQRHHKSLYARN
ncbi:hypothetical protein SARC_03311 [Sphaeroforma arctica JP610]|uniref:Uncharacterized protein n=1 Tax=Sphaeroforma arctica JP610 TaxID=667725 RepID=A0A0L0G8A5_9EUKA|nr:hypothetical protein SARC_03311 [Sphaeroforma arctica JP610]KNC84478.1 hypothetical protein SARC_03311 [Sphaeroforma arctica JP610]|eukprot:XP_014158380.1 hypothetical protein SARC_03311 [Sphaeroforma arctica JP610]